MRTRSLMVFGMGAVLVLGACGRTADPLRAEAPEATTLIPAEGADPVLACGSAAVRHSQLRSLPTLPNDDPRMVAIREIAGQHVSITAYPGGTWLVLEEGEDTVTFIRRLPGQGDYEWNDQVTLRNDDGRWRYAGSGHGSNGPCDRVQPPEGLSHLEWALDTAKPAPTPEATEIHVVVNDRCATRHPLTEDRVVREARFTPDAALVGFAARAVPDPGGPRVQTGDCRPPDRLALTLPLPGPLGARPILDGTFVPPRTPPPASQRAIP
jgi:hypothetical protein